MAVEKRSGRLAEVDEERGYVSSYPHMPRGNCKDDALATFDFPSTSGLSAYDYPSSYVDAGAATSWQDKAAYAAAAISAGSNVLATHSGNTQCGHLVPVDTSDRRAGSTDVFLNHRGTCAGTPPYGAVRQLRAIMRFGRL